MGCVNSKKAVDNPPPTLQISLKFASDLSSYESACKTDPGLKSIDDTLKERTSRALQTIGNGFDFQTHSLDLSILAEGLGSLYDVNDVVVKFILENTKDGLKNQELSDLIQDYFDNSLKTLDFCTALEKCLKGARDSQLIIDLALKQFDKEDAEGEGTENKYSRTLRELHKFKAAGDPITAEFVSLWQSVYTQQVSMMQKLHDRKLKLDKKLHSIKAWKRVSNVIFAVTFVTVLICSVVAAAVTAPPVLTALAAAAAVPLGSMGKWFDSLWKKYEKALKDEKQIVRTVEFQSLMTISDLQSIKLLVDKLENEIDGMLRNANFALDNEDAITFAVDDIKKKATSFMETIGALSERAHKFSQEVGHARTVILQRLVRTSTND